MPVNTKKVEGRRTVRYETMEDMLRDAEQLAGGEVRQLGNWSLGQNLKHIAMTLDASIDGFDMKLPAPVRWVMTLLMKKKFLTKALPPGFKSTAAFEPDPISTEDGMALLREAVERQQREPNRVMHPGFGNLTLEEWTMFHLRHAELHLSFIVPA